MTILALEFSSSCRSVAVGRRDSDGSVVILGVASDSGNRRSPPLPLVNEALERANVRREDIERLAVGLGPGSYTGVRSAIALAQGWQLARNTRLRGISSIETLALQAQQMKWFGRVCIVVNAQRNEFYLAVYEIASDRCRILEPLRLIGLSQVRACADPNSPLFVGPEIEPWLPEGRLAFPEAASLIRLMDCGDAADQPGEKLAPIYLRPIQFVKAPPPRIQF